MFEHLCSTFLALMTSYCKKRENPEFGLFLEYFGFGSLRKIDNTFGYSSLKYLFFYVSLNARLMK